VTYVIRLRAEAESDLFDAAAWYERQRKGLGQEFVDAIERAFDRISDNPLQFPVMGRGIRRALLSRFPFGVFFRIEPEQVTVLAVLHASRHPARWRERSP